MKYLKMIPVILFPYAYILVIAFSPVMSSELSLFLWPILILLYFLLVIFMTIYNAVVTATPKYKMVSVARINLLVKCLQIPAYLFHAFLLVLSPVLSVWGIGVILFVGVVDLATIGLTGLSALGCAVRMKNEKVLPTPAVILLAVGNFLFCVDLICAIVYVVLAAGYEKEKKAVAA